MEEQGSPKRQRSEPPPFSPLCHGRILKEAKLFAQEYDAVNRLWDEECEKYEERMDVCVNGKFVTTIPRRNYPNDDSIVQDVTLFPYHNACYPLVNAYDLPLDENTTSCVALAFPESRRVSYGVLSNKMCPIRGFVPCSTRAIFEALLPELSHEHAASSNDEMSYEIAIREATSHHMKASRTATRTTSELIAKLEEGALPCGSKLPIEREERVAILLRLLRHSLSISKKDYKLAAAAVALLSFRDLNDVDVFRRFLAVLATEYKDYHLRGRCNDTIHSFGSPFHGEFEDSVQNVLTAGIEWMTLEHAECLVGFTRFFLSPEFGSSIGTPCVHLPKEADIFQRDVIVKHKPALICSVVKAVGLRGSIYRDRLLSCHEDIRTPDTNLERYTDMILDSYRNCVRALVGIAELSILYIRERHIFADDIISTLVVSLYNCLARKDRFVELQNEDDDIASFTLYRAARSSGPNDSLRSLRLSASLRYANVVNGTSRPRSVIAVGAEHVIGKRRSSVTLAQMKLESLLESRTPSNVASVVRDLFLTGKVDMRYCTNMGYGDFLVWTGCDVSPLDPVLFSSEYAFPKSEDNGDLDDFQFEFAADDETTWERDEDGRQLTHFELHALHDFSMMLLLRAWQAPWCPKSHNSFQPSFRDAVKTVALCTHRLGFPQETILAISSFLRRDWWDDSRKQCWNLKCQAERSVRSIARRVAGISSMEEPSAFEYCPHCRVAMYCSEACRIYDYQKGHMIKCGRPPLVSQPPGPEELQLCREVLDGADGPFPGFRSDRPREPIFVVSVPNPSMNHVEDDPLPGDESDGDSLETTSTNGKRPADSKTTKIYRYFKKETYKHYQHWYFDDGAAAADDDDGNQDD